jgi:hypothetical protein
MSRLQARMPIYSGSFYSMPKLTDVPSGPPLAPCDHEYLSAFQHSLGASEQQLQSPSTLATAASMGDIPFPMNLANHQQQHQCCDPSSQISSCLPIAPTVLAPSTTEQSEVTKISSLSAANQLAFSNAAAQFAAGFAVAMGMFGPHAGTGPPMFDAMMASHGMVVAAESAAASDVREASRVPASTQVSQQEELVLLAPMPPSASIQFAPAPIPTNDSVQEPHSYPWALPIQLTNDLKPPPS